MHFVFKVLIPAFGTAAAQEKSDPAGEQTIIASNQFWFSFKKGQVYVK